MNRNNIDPTTYDLDFIKMGGRYQCLRCGFISPDKLDLNTPYLDLHCKCGAAVIRIFPERYYEQKQY